jgi:hypothetical protein
MAANNQGRRPLFGPVSQTAYGLDWYQRGKHSAGMAPSNDAQATAREATQNLGVNPQIYRGRVVDVIAYALCYRVMLERNGGVVVCMAATPSGILPVGPRVLASIGPGSEVIVIRFNPGDYGVIIGGFPSPLTDPTLALSDFVHQSSRCGLRVDKTHSAPFSLADHGGIADFSDGRPFDSLSVGEWGAICETGLRQIIDPFMVQLAVDEATGIFAFYHDQLLRVCGYNLQMFSAGHEVEVYNDQCETHHYDGFTPYPWEQVGIVSPGEDPFQENEPKEVQFDKPYYGAWEPTEDDQMPFHRSLLFRGYLGQGGKRMVMAPPDEGPVTYSSDADKHAALWEENLGLDGRYSMRSAKAIHIAKWCAIPPVKRMKRIENADGDNEDNYKFSGQAGSGPDHKVTGVIETTDSDNPHLQQAAGLMDVHAWVFNWLGAHPFHYHAEDWKILEETDTFAEKVEEQITYGDLADQFYLSRPDPVQQKIDHRYDEVDYFPNTSYISLLDDGGVVIGDGYGAEIRMSGGHIFLTAPGDIWVKSGRNFNVLAGYDACFRAKNSMDLSTTDKDLRLKAEKNLHLLGGNDGEEGGVLIECKAPSGYDYQNVVGEEVSMGGFQVKVDKGDACIWASNIYLRTGGGDVEPGVITLDADKGQQAITFNASTIMNYVSESIMDNFGSDGNVEVSHLWSAESNVLGSGVCIQGFGIFEENVLVQGWVEAIAGHFASELSQQYDGKVGVMEGESLFLAYQSMQECETAAATSVQDAITFWQELFTNYLYSDNQAGNDDTITAAHFTFRNPDQYRTNNFKLYEDRWQMMARLAGEELDMWDEKSINGASSEETMPYPGKKPWKDDETFMTMDLQLYDPEQGASIPRSGGGGNGGGAAPADGGGNGGGNGSAQTEQKYEEPKFKEPDKKAPAEGYMIIV